MEFVNILLEEMTEVQKPAVVYEDNQRDTFLERIGKLVCAPITLIYVTIFCGTW